MRWIWATLAGLGLAMAFAIAYPDAAQNQPLAASAWRRTATGWEDTTRWKRPAPVKAVSPHPLLATAFVGLSTGLVLLAFSHKKW